MFRRIGLPIAGLTETQGKTLWYVQPPFERLKNKPQRYSAIRRSLAALIEQAQAVGDWRLLTDLELAQIGLENRYKRRKAR